MNLRMILFMVFIVISISALAQEKQTCCSTVEGATKVSFASFGSDETFRESHQLPNDYSLSSGLGRMIEFPTPSGIDARAYFVNSPKKTNKYLLIIHEWWGLNDNIRREADEISKSLGEVNILALDLYDGKIATTREAAAQLMQSADAERIKQIFEGAVDFAGDGAVFGTLGWCFGGGWSLQMSIWLGEKGKACVMYYGIIENSPETFNELKSPVLGIFAKKDGWITPEVYGKLKKNIESAGKKITIREYDADHAFANPSNQYFDEEATKDAWKNTIEFLKSNLLN